MYLDDRGVLYLGTTERYGDFLASTLSQDIQPIVDNSKGLVINALSVRSKNQYRLFLSSGAGIIMTFDGSGDNMKLVGSTTFEYLDASDAAIQAICVGRGEDSAGDEIMFMGSSDGFVYKIDSGNSINGVEMDHSLTIAYTNLNSPAYNKQFYKFLFELDAARNTVINFRPLYDYGLAEIPTGIQESQTITGGGGYWDEDNWDQFVWAAEDFSLMEANVDGVARNIGIEIQASTKYTDQHTLHAGIIHYAFRRLVR